jgi:RNase adaptor protein for sRNA GlmZ degradation
MTNREELIQELEQAPDDIIQSVLDFVRRVKATRKTHPLAKFAGILNDVEAEELKRAMSDDKPLRVYAIECRQVDVNEW